MAEKRGGCRETGDRTAFLPGEAQLSVTSEGSLAFLQRRFTLGKCYGVERGIRKALAKRVSQLFSLPGFLGHDCRGS